jgi:hypothetical protein
MLTTTDHYLTVLVFSGQITICPCKWQNLFKII